MAKRRNKKESERKRLLSEGYTKCANCGGLITPRSWRCAQCGASTPSFRKALWSIAVIALLFAASLAAYAYYPRSEPYVAPPTVMSALPIGYGASTNAAITVTFNKLMDEPSVESSFQLIPHVAGSFSWQGIQMTFTPSGSLAEETYYTAYIGSGTRDRSGMPLDCGVYSWSFSTAAPPSTRREIGTGVDDFWVAYPSGHPSAGQPVQHPDWVLSALGQSVVMILDHSEGCAPCVRQTQICGAIFASNPDLQYFDLVSGIHEPSASQAFAAYDPNGAIHYVPLTIVVTKAEDELGNIVVAWHAWEGVVDQATLASWIQDAKSHYAESA
ncbi:MAG: Ig-like domain-containing protein [Thermoplasmata archaeon]